MQLQKVMEKFGGHAERLPESQIESGKEIQLEELVARLDIWKEIWDKLNPQTVDQRRHREQSQLRQSLKRQARVLTDMTFQFDVLEGYSREFVCAELIKENPEHEARIKDFFHPDTWWLLIGRVQDYGGSDYLDLCHANTREVIRLKVDAKSPIRHCYELAGPATPQGSIVLF